jgi:hypothetical protein
LDAQKSYSIGTNAFVAARIGASAFLGRGTLLFIDLLLTVAESYGTDAPWIIPTRPVKLDYGLGAI